jgi:hypothetical protein
MVRLQLDERRWKKVELALAAEKRRGRRGLVRIRSFAASAK